MADATQSPPAGGDSTLVQDPPQNGDGETTPTATEEGGATAQPNDGLPEKGEPTAKQAEDALDAMLSIEPPQVPIEDVNMKALALRMERKRKEADPDYKMAEDPDFWVKVRGLGEEEYDLIARRSRRDPTKEEKADGYEGPIVDGKRQKRLVVAGAMLSPDLTNADLLKRDGPTSEHVILRWFLPGEIDQLFDVVTDISGWSKGALERAKK